MTSSDLRVKEEYAVQLVRLSNMTRIDLRVKKEYVDRVVRLWDMICSDH